MDTAGQSGQGRGQRGGRGRGRGRARGRGRGRGRGFTSTNPNMKDDFKHDLNNGQSELFEIQYDIYTPRPCFVIADKERQDWTKFDSKDGDFIAQLIDSACSFVDGDQFASPVLFVKRGSWINARTSHFVAHIEVETEEYLAHYADNKDCIPGWPQNMKPTKAWGASKDPFDYEDNVRGYPYRNFKSKDIKAVKRFLESGEEEVGQLHKPDDEWKLIFHNSKPLIGFKKRGEVLGRWREETEELLLAMDDFARNNDFGCELNISLSQQNIGGFNADEEPVYAFLRLGILEFFKICPMSQRQEWFEEVQA